jgi:hypothetical protein
MITKAQEAEMRRAIVDEFGELEKELAPIGPKVKRYEELAKAIRSWYAYEDGTKAFTAAGGTYQVLLSEKQFESDVDVVLAAKALGRAKFMALASATLKLLKENLSATVLASVVTRTQTGSRKLIVGPATAQDDKAAA